MLTLVIDVAAEHSGALTVLNDYIDSFVKDADNEYIVVLSKPRYQDTSNVIFINCEWVKKTHFHRLFFDYYFINKLVRKYNPDEVLSLQNNAFPKVKKPQSVLFHNALPISEKRFSFRESKSLFIYQNIIGRKTLNSLKKADTIYVQSNWIRQRLCNKVGIDICKVKVKIPEISIPVEKPDKSQNSDTLFYPANGSIYKNHIVLLKALLPIWEKNDYKFPRLILTGTASNLPNSCSKLIDTSKKAPIDFVGHLTKDEMVNMYKNSVLVFPSYIETVGLPLLEAKQLGCTILVADCEYSRETIGSYELATFFDPFDDKELQKLIESL